MVEVREGNLFDDECEALVNTVNCVGVMGRGVALEFKNRFPENFKEYKRACEQGAVKPGKMFVHDTGKLIGPRWIINFPTKRHWKGGSKIEDIAAGLEDLKTVIVANRIGSISLPPLGCGLGGLDWEMVRPLIEDRLSEIPGLVAYLHAPSYNADARPVRNVKPIELRPGRAALVLIAWDYLRRAVDPMLTLLKVHKFMYFLQVRGERLNLKFVKAPYGPYAENLRHFLSRTEGHLLYGFQNNGDQPRQELHLVPSAYEDAVEYIKDYPETAARIDEVSRLTDGFESDDGMELLASVHWVCANEGAKSEGRAYELIHAWNRHKQQFTERQVRAAYLRLMDNGWINEIEK